MNTIHSQQQYRAVNSIRQHSTHPNVPQKTQPTSYTNPAVKTVSAYSFHPNHHVQPTTNATMSHTSLTNTTQKNLNHHTLPSPHGSKIPSLQSDAQNFYPHSSLKEDEPSRVSAMANLSGIHSDSQLPPSLAWVLKPSHSNANVSSSDKQYVAPKQGLQQLTHSNRQTGTQSRLGEVNNCSHIDRQFFF